MRSVPNVELAFVIMRVQRAAVDIQTYMSDKRLAVSRSTARLQSTANQLKHHFCHARWQRCANVDVSRKGKDIYSRLLLSNDIMYHLQLPCRHMIHKIGMHCVS